MRFAILLFEEAKTRFPLTGTERLDAVYIVAKENWREEILKEAEEAGLDLEKIRGFSDLGKTRQESIQNAMRVILAHLERAAAVDGNGEPPAGCAEIRRRRRYAPRISRQVRRGRT